MDFAFLNATVQSPHFPPQDPWLAGHSVSYYYFGYLMMGGMTTLTGLSTSISYNLALATIPALAGQRHLWIRVQPGASSLAAPSTPAP